MYCTNCGNELRDDAKFCTACGQPVKGASDTAETAPLPVAEDAESVTERPECKDDSAAEVPDAVAEPTAEQTAPVEPVDATVAMPRPADAGSDAGAKDAPAAPVVSAGSDIPADSAASTSSSAAPAAPKSNKKTPLIVAGTAAVLVLIALVAFFALRGASSDAMLFGQDTEIELCVTTVVKPYNKNGEAMRTYDAYLVQRDADGAASAIDTTPYHVNIAEYEDLKLSDFDDLPDGSYTLVIVDHSSGSDIQQEIPVNYGKDNAQAGSEVSISTPASEAADSAGETTDQQKAYALYLSKIREYTDLYGACGSSELDGWPVATGLCVADLVDFNADGLEELVLVYNTGLVDGSVSDWMTDQIAAIKTEVWAYSDGEISKVYDLDDTLDTSNGGRAWLSIYKCGDTLELRTFELINDGFDDEGTYYCEYGAVYRAFDGTAFTETQSLYEKLVSPQDGEETDTCTIDGKEVTQDELSAAWDAHKGYIAYSVIEWIGLTSSDFVEESGYLISQLPDLVASTTQKLKEGLGQNVPASKDNAKSEASYASTEIEATVSVPDAQAICMDPEADDAYDATWTYVQFAYKDSTSDTALDALNKKLKSEFEADVDATANWSYSEESELAGRTDTVTSIEGNYACVFHGRYQTNGGPHGWDASETVYYDLSTGEEVSAARALGIEEITLQSYAADGINAFLEQSPSDIGAQDISTRITDMTRYGCDSKGVFFITRSYELGSYAFGSHRIYIMSTTGDDSIVGTECTISSIS